MPHGTPRSARVVHLPPDHQAARLVEQRVRVGPHDQQRHQVLEQRRAPRQQHGRAADAGDRSSEVEPVRLRHVALGDGEEAGEPRLGGEQVVERRIEPARVLGVGEAVADREQLPLRVEEEAEVHRVEERGGARRQRRRDVAQPDRQRQQRAGQVAAVHRRDVGRRQRRQRPRVVPVEQVAFVPLQPLDGRQRLVDPADAGPPRR